jgi:hypothetical protein
VEPGRVVVGEPDADADDGHVDPPGAELAQQHGRAGLLDRDDEAGVVGREAGDGAWHEDRGRVGEGADGEAPDHRIAPGDDLLHRGVELRQHGGGPPGERHARGRRLHATRAAPEQRRASSASSAPKPDEQR